MEIGKQKGPTSGMKPASRLRAGPQSMSRLGRWKADPLALDLSNIFTPLGPWDKTRPACCRRHRSSKGRADREEGLVEASREAQVEALRIRVRDD